MLRIVTTSLCSVSPHSVLYEDETKLKLITVTEICKMFLLLFFDLQKAGLTYLTNLALETAHCSRPSEYYEGKQAFLSVKCVHLGPESQFLAPYKHQNDSLLFIHDPLNQMFFTFANTIVVCCWYMECISADHNLIKMCHQNIAYSLWVGSAF